MNLGGKALSWQLLKAVLSIYFAITLVVTLTQMGVEYLHTRDTIRTELGSIERTFRPALATALWELNAEQLAAIQRGIADLPSISGVRVVDMTGNSLAETREETSLGAGIQHTFRVVYPFAGEDVPLADVTFEASGRVVLDRLRLGYQMILLSALIKSTALTLLFIWAFRRRLGEPLGRLTTAVAAIDLHSLGQRRIDLGQAEENELTRLEAAFNRMLATLDQERRAHDASLEALNKGLEEEVRRRTEELEEANHHLARLARTDPLTGAANRRHFVERAELEIQRAHRNGSPLQLMMLDLDHFKRINDQHGHAVGDAVLRDFVARAGQSLRATDLLARLGGEEFAILLPDTDREGGENVGQRILEALRRQPLEGIPEGPRYTVSIGLTQLTADDARFDSLYTRADQALYRAKTTGRDRLVSD